MTSLHFLQQQEEFFDVELAEVTLFLPFCR